MLDDHYKLKDLDEKMLGTGVVTFALVVRNCEKALGQYGMSFGEFAILWYLSGLKNEINLSQVKRSTFLYSGANITKVTEKLVQKGYINRRENPLSRREKLVKITPSGAKFFGKVIASVRKTYGPILKGVSKSAKESCLKDMNTMFGNLLEIASP